MWFLYTLSWIATVLQVCFVTMAIAAGLYYLAELVEEFTAVAAKAIRYMVLLTLATYIGLFLFENMPLSMIVCGIVAQVSHLALLSSFPFFSFSSPAFLVSMLMVLVNHYLAFSFFGENYFPFSEVMAYFTICMWLVPFSFFVSLSANDNVLPTHTGRSSYSSPGEDDVVSNYFSKKQKGVGLLSVFNSIKDSVTPSKSTFKAF
ncbi:protein TEX261 [Eurytemora carolleeae]|uniref:protein TEX261 n=1 Tax=Eurytemora carolleeae TaxID=1294199 RepID=UPI000C75B959|nr:protein TEX261 [Eurytemora carolleeae]XP_023346293.1 protein TEX261 [Eurytemora carolleeae]XP_023346294.1 protein TEX261 [Eurytemora carolleeae]|eukprot:XP_023346292.1 protein TEX261-like [Eurytemora affinis]